MKCPKCQFDNREGAKFCKECGTLLELTCPECSARFILPSKFCDECGYDLSKVKKALKVDYAIPQTYTPKHLADKILTTRSSIEGERKFVTVLFADVANFTAIARKLDPEDVHQIMDGCFKILMDGIHRYEGTINQFTGDGVMALFGAPLSHENHAQRACYAALSIRKALKDYRGQINSRYGWEFKMRFGINSGLVMVGSIGDDLRMDYTAVGDTTILAKRMESIAKPGSVNLSENTYHLVKAYFEVEALGPVTLKGIKKAQGAYLLLDINKIQTRFEASVSKGLVKFVGRKNSMGVLRNTWNRATDGFGQVLGVMGEPGVGKSRLLLQFISLLSDKDFNYLHGRCLPQGSSITYLPFIDILKSIFLIKESQYESDISQQIKDKLAVLRKDFPPSIYSAVKYLLSLETDDETWHHIEPKLRRQQIFEALKSLIITLSDEKPLIIAVDDLQWIDRSSEEFLSYLIDSISRRPILLILLYRPEYKHYWGAKSNYGKLGLGLLTNQSSSKLISAVLEDNAVSAELEQLILKQSSGNPLFIEELIYTLMENDYIEKRGTRFILSHRPGSIKIPNTIQSIIAARIDKLNADRKHVLQVASVIGQDFGYRILQTVTGLGEELESILDDLQRLEFIYEKEFFPELEYTFKHALIQEVAYGGLLLKQRIEIHDKVGLAIETFFADKLDEFYEILSHHYSIGKNFSKAYQYTIESGKKADANFSHLEAFNYFRHALKIFDKLQKNKNHQRDKLEIHNLLMRPIAMLGHPKGSLKILQDGTKIAKELGDQKSLSRYYNATSLLYTVRGDSLLSIKNSEKSFTEAGKIEDIEIMAPVALSLCYAYASSSNYDKLIDITSKVSGLIEKTERKSDFFNTPFILYSFFLGLCGMAMGMHGDFRKGKLFCEKGLNHVIEIGHATTRAFNELQYANLLILKGDGRAAIAHCHSSIKHSEDTKWPTILSQAWTILGYAKYLLGELDLAREYVAKGLKIQEDSGIEAMLSLPYWILAMIVFDFGDLEYALKCAEKALELSNKNSEIRYEGLSKICIGRILGSKHMAQYEEGEQFVLEGYNIMKKLRALPAMAIGQFNLGELYANSGDPIKAAEHLIKARSMFEEMEMDYWSAKVLAALKDFK